MKKEEKLIEYYTNDNSHRKWLCEMYGIPTHIKVNQKTILEFLNMPMTC